MPFDAGPSRPERIPPVNASIDWIDWGLRFIVFGSLLVLWVVWAAMSMWSAVVQDLGFF